MDTEKNESDSPAHVGPSQFSETTNRLLSLGWEEILRTHGFTNGSHFKWRESERRRRQRNRPGSATSAKDTDYIGITKTCEVATERFRALEHEYFNLWARNHSLRTEEFTKTLIFVKQQVEREVSNLWIGKDSLHTDWYVRACRPIVKKELSALVEEAESQARAYEIRVLKRRQGAERDPFSQTIFKVLADSSAVVGAGTATPDADEGPNPNAGDSETATSETLKRERGIDIRKHQERAEFEDALSTELASIRDFTRSSSSVPTLTKFHALFPDFKLWSILSKPEQEELISKEFKPKAYARTLTARKFGVEGETIKKSRQLIKGSRD